MDPLYILHETAAGIAVFRVREFDDAAKATQAVQASVQDAAAFSRMVALEAFMPFSGNEEAAAAALEVDSGRLPKKVLDFLGSLKGLGEHPRLGVVDERLKLFLEKELPGLEPEYSSLMIEISRGIRRHYSHLTKADATAQQTQAQLDSAAKGLAHLVSRQLVAYDKNKADAMVIQGIGYYETVLKYCNTYFMRLSETYSYHFPELLRILGSDHHSYTRCVLAIGRKEDLIGSKDAVKAFLENTDLGIGREKREEIIAAAKTSTGATLDDADLEAIRSLATRTLERMDERQSMTDYLGDKMHTIAPNTAALMGDLPAARLLAKSGGLRYLCKAPASTIQVLGAERALFRALKSRGNKKTPKYGLLFASAQVTQADARNKGRVARALACAIAKTSKIDRYAEKPTTKYGEAMHQMLEDRINFLKTGRNPPRKNLEVMMELQGN